jgi:hypothetical protein
MDQELQERVHALVRGECSAADFLQQLPALCDAAPDEVWNALSLIDQYHRRSKLSAELYQTLKQHFEHHALGAPAGGPPIVRSNPEPCGAPQRAVIAKLRRSQESRRRADDAEVLRLELLSARRRLQRYRKRIAVLANFGRRTREALRAARRDLSVARGQALGERDRISPYLATTSRGRSWSIRSWPINSAHIPVLAFLLLGMGASRALQDLPPPRRALPLPQPRPVAPQVTQPGELSLSADRYIVLPGQRSAEIEVKRSGGSAGEVSFRWWTRGSGARPDRDYVSVDTRIVRVPDGVEGLRLSVPILKNPARTHTELFYVAIAKPSGGASLGSIRQATVFILPP